MVMPRDPEKTSIQKKILFSAPAAAGPKVYSRGPAIRHSQEVYEQKRPAPNSAWIPGDVQSTQKQSFLRFDNVHENIPRGSPGDPTIYIYYAYSQPWIWGIKCTTSKRNTWCTLMAVILSPARALVLFPALTPVLLPKHCTAATLNGTASNFIHSAILAVHRSSANCKSFVSPYHFPGTEPSRLFRHTTLYQPALPCCF